MTEIIKRYDFILSLGRFCHTTGMLNINGLKLFDGPWDWSGTGDIEGIYKRIKCLYKGFNHWFDYKNFVPMEPKYHDKLYNGAITNVPRPQIGKNTVEEQNPNPYIGIFNTSTLTYYIHDWKQTPSFDEQFPGIAEKYNRRAYRTQRFIEQSDSILLIYMSHLADQKRDLQLNQNIIIRLMTNLRKKYKNKIIDLYMFDHSNDKIYYNGFYTRQILDVGIIRYISNHDDVWPENDPDPHHNVHNFMLPISVCNILSQIGLTDKWRMP